MNNTTGVNVSGGTWNVKNFGAEDNYKGNNSTISGGKGKDTFLYADDDGNDVIYNFDNDDILKITGAFSTSRNKSKKEVYFKVGSTSNAITLKNFTATSFNINGTSYKLGSSKLVKR